MKTKTKLLLTIGCLALLTLGGLTQSKYVRQATITMNVTSEASDPTGVFVDINTGNNATSGEFVAPKNGKYVIQLRGGDGGNTTYGIGGRGGVVEAVYDLNKGDTIFYSLGGKAADNTAGGSNYTDGAGNPNGSGGKGGNPNGSGGGGASAVNRGSDLILVAGGGGGASGGTSGKGSYLGGNGASFSATTTVGPITTSKNEGADGKNGPHDSKDGQNGDGSNHKNGGGGAGGGYDNNSYGGTNGGEGNSFPGGGDGGASYAAGFITTMPNWETTYAGKLSTTDGTDLTQPTKTQGEGSGKAGQIRIIFLLNDNIAGHTNIPNIYQ